MNATTAPFIRDKTFAHFRPHLMYIRKHHGAGAAVCFYAAMVARLTASTTWQAARWLAGAAPFSQVRERWERQLNFALLRPGRRGIEP